MVVLRQVYEIVEFRMIEVRVCILEVRSNRPRISVSQALFPCGQNRKSGDGSLPQRPSRYPAQFDPENAHDDEIGQERHESHTQKVQG